MRYLKTGFVLVAVVGAILGVAWMSRRPIQEPALEGDSVEGAVDLVDVVDGVDGDETDPAGQWSTYHGDAALTGSAPGALPGRLRVLWRFEAGAAVRGTPVVSGGHVFFANAKGEVSAINLLGRKTWSKALTGQYGAAAIDAPLACFDSSLYVGTAGGTLHALDMETGEERWRRDIGGPILGTPNSSGKALYVVAQDEGVLHCLDPVTGNPIWRSEGVSRCDGSPSIGDNAVVFGSCAAAIHVFSADTGKLERNIEIDDDSQVAGGVALVGGHAFSGCRSGKVLRVNVKTGAIVWVNKDTDFEVFATPAVSNGQVVFGSFDGCVYALDMETGVQRWRFETRGTPESPVIVDGKVVAAADGTLYLLDLEKGSELWSHEVSDFITAPAVAGGMVLVGCDDGTVAAFGASE